MPYDVKKQATIPATTLLLMMALCGAARAADLADLVQASGVKGGLVVQLGCDDGKQTVALRLNERYLVQGLDTDAANIQAARDAIRKAGDYGGVSAKVFDGERLPYADNLVNLIIAQGKTDVSEDEMLRALAPGGVAMIAGKRITKPVPDDIDDWSHHLQGADNNAVAMDQQVATPRRMKWVCGPLWSRSHEFLSSISAMISAEGRVFYIVDEGLTSVTDKPIPEKWMLTARDAFNGLMLWQRPMDDWGSGAWKKTALRATPKLAPFRIVAGGGRLFVTLGYSSPVSALDAATGEELIVYKGTDGAQEMRFLDGVLLIRTSSAVLAFNVKSGKQQWTAEGKVVEQAIAADAGRAYYQIGPQLFCRSLKDGAPLWDADIQGAAGRLIIYGDRVVVSARGGFQVLEADSGKPVWDRKIPAGSGPFVANDRLWVSGPTALEMSSGESIYSVDGSEVMTQGHHPRCYPPKATENFLITANRGIEFVNLTGEQHSQNDWTRGPCTFGILPCNGLLYVPPNPCFCYTGAKISGFNVFAGESEIVESNAPRLEKGEAYGKKIKAAKGNDDWPAYRGGGLRRGSSKTTVATDLTRSWKVDVGGRLTQAVVAQGKVLVASKDTHTLHAFDEKNGKALWTYTADGRIDSPPTVDAGRVLIGSADGKVACLSASDGRLIWRFRAAPNERQIMAFNQLESPWRVHGSVLVENGVAYFTAGRSTNLDGGIRIFALDGATGKVLHSTTLDTWSATRDDAIDKPFIPSYHIEGAFSDILSCESGAIFLGQYKFDMALKQLPVPYVLTKDVVGSQAMGREELTGQPFAQGMETMQREEKIQREWQLKKWPAMAAEHKAKYGGSSLGDRTMGRHVFSTGGFLDNAWFNRTFWTYSPTWPGFYIAHRAAKTGQIIAVDDEKTYALQAFPRRNVQSPLFTPGDKGYLLFADDNENDPVIADYTRGVVKGLGFTRKDEPKWFHWIPLRVQSMAATDNALFVAGPPDELVEGDIMASFEGRMGARLWSVSKEDGKKLADQPLDALPVFDGMSAANGKLYIALQNGTLERWE